MNHLRAIRSAMGADGRGLGFSGLRTFGLASVLMFGAVLGLGSGCTEANEAREPTALDTRLETHAVLSGEPTAEGLAYVLAVADAHDQADQSDDPRATQTILLAAVERPPPAGDGAAELLHYELLARSSELLLASGDSEGALLLLAPRLEPELSLPIDRASARCLVALGDAAAHTGDHALAMGSYARALEMLTLLLEQEEVES